MTIDAQTCYAFGQTRPKVAAHSGTKTPKALKLGEGERGQETWEPSAIGSAKEGRR